MYERPHRLEAKDAGPSSRRSRVRIPLGVPDISAGDVKAAMRGGIPAKRLFPLASAGGNLFFEVWLLLPQPRSIFSY